MATIQQCRCSWASFLPASGHIWNPQISLEKVEGYFQPHGMSHGLPFLPDQHCRESGTHSCPCVVLKIFAVRWVGQEKHSRVSEHSIWKQENVSLCYCKLNIGDGSWRKGQGSLPVTAVLVFSFLSFSSSFSLSFLFPGQAAGRGMRSWQWHRRSPTNGWEGPTICAWNPTVSEDEEKPSSQRWMDSQVFTFKRKSFTLSSKKQIPEKCLLHPILPNHLITHRQWPLDRTHVVQLVLGNCGSPQPTPEPKDPTCIAKSLSSNHCFCSLLFCICKLAPHQQRCISASCVSLMTTGVFAASSFCAPFALDDDLFMPQQSLEDHKKTKFHWQAQRGHSTGQLQEGASFGKGQDTAAAWVAITAIQKLHHKSRTYNPEAMGGHQNYHLILRLFRLFHFVLLILK